MKKARAATVKRTRARGDEKRSPPLMLPVGTVVWVVREVVVAAVVVERLDAAVDEIDAVELAELSEDEVTRLVVDDAVEADETGPVPTYWNASLKFGSGSLSLMRKAYLPDGRPLGVNVNEVVVTPEAMSLTGTMVLAVGPSTRVRVTGPTASLQVRVKGMPSFTSNSRLLKEGLARPTAARTPTMAAMENFIVNVCGCAAGEQ